MCQTDVLSSSEFLLFLLMLSGSGGPRHWAGSPRPLSLSLLLFTPGAHQRLIFDNRQSCLLTHSEHPLFGHPMTADHHRAAIESPGLGWNRSFSALWTHFQEFWLGRGQLCLEMGNLHRHQWASEEVALLWLLEFSSLFSGSWVFLAPSCFKLKTSPFLHCKPISEEMTAPGYSLTESKTCATGNIAKQYPIDHM